MEVQCPGCKKTYDLNLSHLAKGPVKVKCPKCKHAWVVKPAAAESGEAVANQKAVGKIVNHREKASTLPKLMPTKDIVTLRALVGFLGESPQFGWWDTNFLSRTGLQFLAIPFPRTAFAAGCVSVAEAAKRLHDERIGKGGVFHLFRLPSAIEEKLHKHLLDMQPAEILSALEDKEKAIEKLREFAEADVQVLEGPIHIGKADKIMTEYIVSELATHYLDAFSKGLKTFPYFTEQS